MKYTLDLPEKMDSRLSLLAKEEKVTKAQLIRNALGLYSFVHEERKSGACICSVKDGQVLKEIVFN